jgi:hypothetical protein
MIVQITLIKNELFLLKEMLPIWQKYADGFVFMDDESDDGTYEYLMDNREKYNILAVLKSNKTEDILDIESNIRQRLFDEAFKHSGHIICLDTDEYLDGSITKLQLEEILTNNRDTLIHLQWIQYTNINQIRTDGPWKFNLKDRIGSYTSRCLFKPAQMHSEHLPVPSNQVMIRVPQLFIAHLQWLDKETVAIKQYYWKIRDFITRTKFGGHTVSASAYDASVNNFAWTYEQFDFPLKVDSNIYKNLNKENNYKYKFIQENIKRYNIPNLNDWGMGIHQNDKGE